MKEERPGNNSYSKENVWKDEQGLHLKITNKSGKWYCSEVWMNQSLGYGKYNFYIAGGIDQLDKNVVAGLFTWDNESKNESYREIDIEFTRWGDQNNPNNAQYNLIPQEDPDDQNKRAHPFSIILTGDYSTHSFDWGGWMGERSLSFESLHDHPQSSADPKYLIESWEYPKEKVEDIPLHGNETVHINLWLFDTDGDGFGDPPSNETEIIIKDFKFQPNADAVWLDYQNINGKNGRLISSDFMIDEEAHSTYFCVFSWTSPNEGTVGYYGMQSEGGSPNPKHMHVSVWDPPIGGETTFKNNGTDVYCEHICDVEGCYCKCTWELDWQENRVYNCKVKASTNNTSTFYDVSFSDKHLVTFECPKEDRWIDAVATMIEDFWPPNPDAKRSFQVGNGFKQLEDNTSIKLDTVIYSPVGIRGNRNAKAEGSWFILESGNGVIQEMKPRVAIYWDSVMRIYTTCPVDIEVIDPEGLKINKQSNEIPSSKYSEYYIDDDNDLDDEIIISDKKSGIYQIKIIPEPGAEPTDIYTLRVSTGDKTTVLADNVSINDIPPEPYFFESETLFDTRSGDHSSISGTHNGTILPSWKLTVSKLYTYSCSGTGGHTESVRIWNSTTGWNVTATWNGYTGDWHNLTFNNSFTLYANETYNYTIRTGSYPQIIHKHSWNAIGGVITCSEFIDSNGERYAGGVPAIKLY